MKNINLGLILVLIFIAFAINTNAQTSTTTKNTPKKNKIYPGTMAEGNILSVAFTDFGGSSSVSTLRYSAFAHLGFTLNKDFSKSVGLFTGLSIKNIGLITKEMDSTVKRRVYTIGVPLGLKIGRMGKKYFLVGGGADFPFNYKEKGFKKRNEKTKFNEWFSDRTPSMMPYAFAGFHTKAGFQLKLQYYPQNFFNTDFESAGVKIYNNYQANLLLLTFGSNIDGMFKKKGKSKKTFKFPKPSSTKTL